MQTRSLYPVVAPLLSTVLLGSFACAGGELDEGGGTFTTTTTTTNTTTTTDGSETETGRDDTDTGGDGDGDPPPPPEPTCDDGEQNQDETDLDCGGPNCDPCGDGQACEMDSDCDTQSCVGGLCIIPACDDGVKNGDETDVDCGGGCSPCADNLGCSIAGDCLSGVCAGDFCAAPNCGDGVQNGNETALDCGGGRCMGCAEGASCNGDSDCLSQFCQNSQCAPADCQIDADCAEFNTQCTTGVCNPQKTCDAVPANNGNPCNDGEACTTGETCNAGVCGGGGPVDCSGLSNACNLGVCNPQDGTCQAQPANNGNPCNDNNACTVGEVCNAGSCADPNAPGYIFYEDFNDNSAGWTFGTEWGIAPATASGCALSCPGNDPSTDHTPTGDNGVAGAVIGGCISTAVHADYCITSPIINTASLNSVWLTYWRHLHSDYTPYMLNKVEVFNGNTWVQLWASGGSPCINDANWTEVAFNITAQKSTGTRIRFCHSVGSTGAFSSGGWSIDDVVIGPAQCTPS